MNKINNKIKGTLLVLLGGTCWGFSGTCGQYLFTLKNVNTEWLTSVRLFFAGLVLVIFACLTQRNNVKAILSHKKDRITLAIFGILGLMLCQYTYFAAIAHSNAATGTVLQYLGPAMIMLYVCFSSRKLPNKKEILAVMFALTGTFLLATHGNINSLAISPIALFWGIASAASLASYTLIPVKLLSKYGSVTVTGFGMLIAGIFFTVISRAWQIPQDVDFTIILMCAVIIVIGTVIPFTIYLKGVNYVGASKASMISCIEPVSATFFSTVWLKNKFTLIDFLGFALIITTVLMLSKKEENKG